MSIARQPQGHATKIGGATVPFVGRTEATGTGLNDPTAPRWSSANGRQGFLGKVLNVIDPVPAPAHSTTSAAGDTNYLDGTAQPGSASTNGPPHQNVATGPGGPQALGRDAAVAGGSVRDADADPHYHGLQEGSGWNGDSRTEHYGPGAYNGSNRVGRVNDHPVGSGQGEDNAYMDTATAGSFAPGAYERRNRVDPVDDYPPGGIPGQNGTYGDTAYRNAVPGSQGTANANSGPVNGDTNYSGRAQPTATGAGSNVNPNSGHANIQGLKGRFQEGVGNMTGSDNMQARGAANQRQGTAEHWQSGELNEASRLENDAQLRRDRAVAQGAHPVHQNLRGEPQRGTAY